jgi:hypothetical protein
VDGLCSGHFRATATCITFPDDLQNPWQQPLWKETKSGEITHTEKAEQWTDPNGAESLLMQQQCPRSPRREKDPEPPSIVLRESRMSPKPYKRCEEPRKHKRPWRERQPTHVNPARVTSIKDCKADTVTMLQEGTPNTLEIKRDILAKDLGAKQLRRQNWA